MTTQTEKPRGRALESWSAFETELKSRDHELAALLPPNVNKERFVASAVAAVKQTPALLEATTRSLFTAITKSAQDGLLPDGREGVITVYNTKISGTDQYEKIAQWNPMTHGLRKRARELDSILIDAQCVHEFDEFLWKQGDQPAIEHKPPKLGEERGPILGAYAIFKREDGTILHREVMAMVDIDKVRKQSKAENSLMWTTFISEGCRKTVIRRGIKSVPVSDKLTEIVRRDDEEFDFAAPPSEDRIVVPPRPQKSEFERKPVTDPGKMIEGKATVISATDTAQGGGADPELPAHMDRRDDIVRNPPADGSGQNIDPKAKRMAEQASWYAEKKRDIPMITVLRELMSFADETEPHLLPDQLKEFEALIVARQNEIMATAKKK